jgi:hypothetical protein
MSFVPRFIDGYDARCDGCGAIAEGKTKSGKTAHWCKHGSVPRGWTTARLPTPHGFRNDHRCPKCKAQ